MLAALAGSVAWAAPETASACGGFFCSQSQPVNQAAERIIFANNGDGTVTAIIQILYEGPSEDFSWLLPISSVPDEEDEIAVASDLAFQRLQAATNPQYNLTVQTEGVCREESERAEADPTSPDLDPGVAAPDEAFGPGGVNVAASGVVGSFDWTALELDPMLDDPAQAALDWLTDNGYDVLPESAELIGPYLESGMYLLALRLTKGATTGSIRPIVLTYDGDAPSIPIKLTAVAANDDMGVMTWMLSGNRAVPFNYNALELNEARINWFNASSNYDSVVTAAANDSGGQGFVTEFAGASSTLAGVVWPDFEEANWQSVRQGVYSSFQQIFDVTYNQYAGYDGFWDAVRTAVTLEQGLAFEDFQLCPQCYSDQVSFSPTAYMAAIEEGVIQPIRRVQQLIDSLPYTTRMYSTLSAADMTVDPVFTFNPDLPEVNNVHTATRTIECSPSVYSWEAPWRIDLPQGGSIRGTPDTVGSWPAEVDDQPANLRVLTLSSAGSGLVSEDNAEVIGQMLEDYNDTIPAPGVGPEPDPVGSEPDPVAPPGGQGTPPMAMGSNSGGCGLAGTAAGGVAWPAAALGLMIALGARRRRSRAPRSS
jgi:hypothetical protein